MREYKVVTQESSFFLGKATPDKIQSVLNELAEDGWRPIAVSSLQFPAGFMGERSQLCMFLERELS